MMYAGSYSRGIVVSCAERHSGPVSLFCNHSWKLTFPQVREGQAKFFCVCSQSEISQFAAEKLSQTLGCCKVGLATESALHQNGHELLQRNSSTSTRTAAPPRRLGSDPPHATRGMPFSFLACHHCVGGGLLGASGRGQASGCNKSGVSTNATQH